MIFQWKIMFIFFWKTIFIHFFACLQNKLAAYKQGLRAWALCRTLNLSKDLSFIYPLFFIFIYPLSLIYPLSILYLFEDFSNHPLSIWRSVLYLSFIFIYLLSFIVNISYIYPLSLLYLSFKALSILYLFEDLSNHPLSGVYYKTCGGDELATFLENPEEFLPPISIRRLPEDPDYLPRKRDAVWAKERFPQQVWEGEIGVWQESERERESKVKVAEARRDNGKKREAAP